MANKMRGKRNKQKLPAIPPEDYEGTLADWLTGLISRGLWDEKDPEWFGDVMISRKDYADLLQECEEREKKD